MPRKGWSTMEVPSGWLQVIRGPRPRSVQWPRASAPPRQSNESQPRPQPKQSPVEKTFALKRAKELKVQLVDVQIKECEGFLSRARAHLTELDAKRSTVSANIRDTEQRLEALKQRQQFAPPPDSCEPRSSASAGGTKISSRCAWRSCRSGSQGDRSI